MDNAKNLTNLNPRQIKGHPERQETTTTMVEPKRNRSQSATNPAQRANHITTTYTNNTDNISPPTKHHAKHETIYQWNICGLRGKIPELHLITNEYKPKVIALQETMFNNKKIRR